MEFTEEQLKFLKEVKQEWFDLILKSGKKLTKAQIKADINWLYKLLKFPTPEIYIMDSYKSFRDKIKEVAGQDNPTEFGLIKDNWLLEFECAQKLDLIETVDFTRYIELIKKGVYTMSLYDEAVFICRLPTKVKLDDQNRLHSVTGPAVEWNNGDKNYAIKSVSFSEALWKKVTQRKLSAKEILGLDNIEQRYVALELFGFDTLIDDLGGKLIDTSPRGNKLYAVKDVIPNTEVKMLKYTCPSTGRVYTSLVPRETKKADAAMAWKFYMKEEDYANLKVEA